MYILSVWCFPGKTNVMYNHNFQFLIDMFDPKATIIRRGGLVISCDHIPPLYKNVQRSQTDSPICHLEPQAVGKNMCTFWPHTEPRTPCNSCSHATSWMEGILAGKAPAWSKSLLGARGPMEGPWGVIQGVQGARSGAGELLSGSPFWSFFSELFL